MPWDNRMFPIVKFELQRSILAPWRPLYWYPFAERGPCHSFGLTVEFKSSTES